MFITRNQIIEAVQLAKSGAIGINVNLINKPGSLGYAVFVTPDWQEYISLNSLVLTEEPETSGAMVINDVTGPSGSSFFEEVFGVDQNGLPRQKTKLTRNSGSYFKLRPNIDYEPAILTTLDNSEQYHIFGVDTLPVANSLTTPAIALFGTAGQTSFQIEYTTESEDNFGVEATEYEYIIETTNQPADPANIVGSFPGIEDFPTFSNLDPSTTYYVYVRGKSGTLVSAWSTQLTVSTEPATAQVPTSALVSGNVVGNVITVQWDNIDGNLSFDSSGPYQVQRETQWGFSFSGLNQDVRIGEVTTSGNTLIIRILGCMTYRDVPVLDFDNSQGRLTDDSGPIANVVTFPITNSISGPTGSEIFFDYNSGNNANPGTEASPKKTLDPDDLSDGDVAIFINSNYFESIRYGNPATYTNRVYMFGNNLQFDDTTTNLDCIQLRADNICLVGFDFRNSNVNSRAGIQLFTNSNNVTLYSLRSDGQFLTVTADSVQNTVDNLIISNLVAVNAIEGTVFLEPDGDSNNGAFDFTNVLIEGVDGTQDISVTGSGDNISLHNVDTNDIGNVIGATVQYCYGANWSEANLFDTGSSKNGIFRDCYCENGRSAVIQEGYFGDTNTYINIHEVSTNRTTGNSVTGWFGFGLGNPQFTDPSRLVPMTLKNCIFITNDNNGFALAQNGKKIIFENCTFRKEGVNSEGVEASPFVCWSRESSFTTKSTASPEIELKNCILSFENDLSSQVLCFIRVQSTSLALPGNFSASTVLADQVDLSEFVRIDDNNAGTDNTFDSSGYATGFLNQDAFLSGTDFSLIDSYIPQNPASPAIDGASAVIVVPTSLDILRNDRIRGLALDIGAIEG